MTTILNVHFQDMKEEVLEQAKQTILKTFEENREEALSPIKLDKSSTKPTASHGTAWSARTSALTSSTRPRATCSAPTVMRSPFFSGSQAEQQQLPRQQQWKAGWS
eukprot:CAMPEP_0170458062 /NCGR_PEP_ID=MMETSP0123-20130129/5145_1 /TAXON_ID=182087 /ORGANISM="Favella ehrenbergii, Strain Fehren 1" /LENGTH=105 /DNA_ID=CAMNT_0010722061 /DNA_START=29 /DNA_END=347 /DNA_ORIENTATION=+